MRAVLYCLVSLFLCYEVFTASIDKKKAKGPKVVEAVIDAIQEKCVFEDDAQMLRRWARASSDDGRAPETFRSAFYGGIWQLTEKQYLETKNANETLLTSIKSEFGIDWVATKWEDLLKPLYSGLAARLSFTTVEKKLKTQSYLWSVFTGLPSSKYIDAAESFTLNCSIASDVLFLFDGSLGIKKEDVKKMKKFMMNLVNKLDVSQDNTRIGYEILGTYDSSAILFDQFYTPESIERALELIAWPSAGFNYGNFFVVRSMFYTGARDWAPDISIFITNGKSNNYGETLRSAENYLRSGVTSFAIGVGPDANLEELSAIASDGDCNHLFLVDSFDELDLASAQIEQRICKTINEEEPAEEVEPLPSNSTETNTTNSTPSENEKISQLGNPTDENITSPTSETENMAQSTAISSVNLTKPLTPEADNLTLPTLIETDDTDLEDSKPSISPIYLTEMTTHPPISFDDIITEETNINPKILTPSKTLGDENSSSDIENEKDTHQNTMDSGNIDHSTTLEPKNDPDSSKNEEDDLAPGDDDTMEKIPTKTDDDDDDDDDDDESPSPTNNDTEDTNQHITHNEITPEVSTESVSSRPSATSGPEFSTLFDTKNSDQSSVSEAEDTNQSDSSESNNDTRPWL